MNGGGEFDPSVGDSSMVLMWWSMVCLLYRCLGSDVFTTWVVDVGGMCSTGGDGRYLVGLWCECGLLWGRGGLVVLHAVELATTVIYFALIALLFLSFAKALRA